MPSNNTVDASPAASPKKLSGRRDAELLTKGERIILDALKRAIREYGQPTMREIAAIAHYDVSHVHRSLVRLADKGLVEMTRKFRGVRLVRRPAKKVA